MSDFNDDHDPDLLAELADTERKACREDEPRLADVRRLSLALLAGASPAELSRELKALSRMALTRIDDKERSDG